MKSKIKAVVAKMFPTKRQKVKKSTYCIVTVLAVIGSVSEFIDGRKGMGVLYAILFAYAFLNIFGVEQRIISFFKKRKEEKAVN